MDNHGHTLGSVFGTMVGPAWSHLKPLADIAAIAAPPAQPDWANVLGVKAMGPIVLDGLWLPTESVSGALQVKPRRLPRKTKKVLAKMFARRPLGRREHVRGIVFTYAGVKMRLLPD